MGYRSDVVLAMKDEKFVELVKNMDDRVAVNFFDGTEPKKKDNWTLVCFNDAKWYDSFPEVKAIEVFVSTLDEDDFAYHILGEESDDYIHKGTWDTPFGIRMTRSLDFEW